MCTIYVLESYLAVRARGDTVILTENDSNDSNESKTTVWIPKESQSMTANDSVERPYRPGLALTPGRRWGLAGAR
jgi:hypothetical protein